MPIGDTLVTTLYSFKELFGRASGGRLNDENSIWAGYAWIGERIPGFDIHENRFWQQWITTRQRGDVSFQFRSRLEQRFVSAGAQVGWRFRQLVRVQKPLEHHPDLTLGSLG